MARACPWPLVVGSANCNDHQLLAETLDSLVVRRPAHAAKVQHLCLDRGYDDTGSRRRGDVVHIRGRQEEVPEQRRGRK